MEVSETTAVDLSAPPDKGTLITTADKAASITIVDRVTSIITVDRITSITIAVADLRTGRHRAIMTT